MNCLDAETLAAWFDGGLSGAALEELRSHVAGCARCQSLVGAMGRTRAAVPASAAERAPKWWLAWAVPAAAVATAVAIWVAVPRPANVAVNSTPAPSLQEQEKAPQLNAAAPPAAATAEPAPATQAPRLSELQDSARTAKTAAAPPAPATPQLTQQEADSNAAATLSAPAALPAERREAAQAPAGVAARQLQARDAFAANTCGPKWPPPPADLAAQIVVASAPSADVCWMVGRGGIVLRSTDHETWQRVNIPQALDLSAISATDARTATVTAADGRTFSTADGGMSWNQR